MDSPIQSDPYKILDVPQDASLATIRSAHRKLVLKTHPDKVQGDDVLKKKRADEFHHIQQAYEILSDDSRREAYDDKVKLATLQAERMAERGSSRNASNLRPMNGRSPTIEVRGGRLYEERAPRRSWEDQGDDFFSFKPRDLRPRYDDNYMPPSSRKSSIRVQEEKPRRTARDIEENNERERYRREHSYAKAEKKTAFAERDKRRTKDRRESYDAKYRGARVEEASDTSSASSDTDFTYQPKRREEPSRHRYEDMRRKDREDPPRRVSKRDVDDNPYETLESNIPAVQDYIRQSREPELDPRRPALYKGVSTREIRPTPPPTPSTNPRRSSGRPTLRRESSPPPKSSSKNYRPPEIVDQPDVRKSKMAPSSSDPKGLRGMTNGSSRGKPFRASTVDPYVETRQPGIQRSSTMPIHRSRQDDHQYSKSSRAKEVDSDYSSSDAPPAHSPKTKSKKIFIVEEEDENPRSYSTVYLAPEDKYRRERDMSPPPRKASERPSMSARGATTLRVPPSRSTSYAPDADEPRPPRLKRSETEHISPLASRPSGNNSPRQYFGEMPRTEEPYKIVNQAPKIGPHNIRYGTYDRRGSEESHGDWAPGSEFGSRNRPSYERSTSRVY
ncbi:MAG: hypothetical protein Q9220_006058 [cf. Caloplaca sp. 1 TL-2023]